MSPETSVLNGHNERVPRLQLEGREEGQCGSEGYDKVRVKSSKKGGGRGKKIITKGEKCGKGKNGSQDKKEVTTKGGCKPNQDYPSSWEKRKNLRIKRVGLKKVDKEG